MPNADDVKDKDKDELEDLYDPNKWPDWNDFLNWLRKLLGAIFDLIFGR